MSTAKLQRPAYAYPEIALASVPGTKDVTR